jgi:hypothetical protein
MHVTPWVKAGFVATAAALGLAVTASPAAASVPSNFCDPHAYTYVVKNYYRSGAAYTMRCGIAARNWGFRHLVADHEWNAQYDAWIALTIAHGADVNDVQNDGGSVIFAIFDGNCNELFRVIYNGGAYNGNGVRPQGLITAYYEGGPISAIAATEEPSGVAAQLSANIPSPPGSYRANCYVYQNI